MTDRIIKKATLWEGDEPPEDLDTDNILDVEVRRIAPEDEDVMIGIYYIGENPTKKLSFSEEELEKKNEDDVMKEEVLEAIKENQSFPSFGRIHKEYGFDEDKLKKALRELVRDGYLETYREEIPEDVARTKLYRLTEKAKEGDWMSEESPEPSCPNSNCQSLNVVYQRDGWYECKECEQRFKLPVVGENKIKMIPRRR